MRNEEKKREIWREKMERKKKRSDCGKSDY